jgi:hypothetical protein
MVRPISFAAAWLTTNSNFSGCSIDMSAGFTPFKILSTKPAAWYQISRKSAPCEMNARAKRCAAEMRAKHDDASRRPLERDVRPPRM